MSFKLRTPSVESTGEKQSFFAMSKKALIQQCRSSLSVPVLNTSFLGRVSDSPILQNLLNRYLQALSLSSTAMTMPRTPNRPNPRLQINMLLPQLQSPRPNLYLYIKLHLNLHLNPLMEFTSPVKMSTINLPVLTISTILTICTSPTRIWTYLSPTAQLSSNIQVRIQRKIIVTT